MIYLDNAASSWPKPKTVVEAVTTWMTNNGANPGRGTHAMAKQAEDMLYATRTELAGLFAAANPEQIILLQNVTEALNLALYGGLEPGDHVVATGLEHNAVRRPLIHLARNVLVTWVEYDENRWIDAILDAVTPQTKMVVVTHGSNVTGDILPIEIVGQQLQRFPHPPLLVVDAAQTAGHVPINVEQAHIDLLAFTGHKGLMGPQGTGGLYIRPGIQLKPILLGGTGGDSVSPEGPANSPHRYEAGTRNTPGFAGLREGVRYIKAASLASIMDQGQQLTDRLVGELAIMDGVRVLGPPPLAPRLPLVSITVAGYQATEVAMILDEHYGIAVRAGLHCAPRAHEQLGTLVKDGATRISIGHFNTVQDIDACVSAIRDLLN